jgi:hypothetical protein
MAPPLGKNPMKHCDRSVYGFVAAGKWSVNTQHGCVLRLLAKCRSGLQSKGYPLAITKRVVEKH